jgi:hypothetical protein
MALEKFTRQEKLLFLTLNEVMELKAHVMAAHKMVEDLLVLNGEEKRTVEARSKQLLTTWHSKFSGLLLQRLKKAFPDDSSLFEDIFGPPGRN